MSAAGLIEIPPVSTSPLFRPASRAPANSSCIRGRMRRNRAQAWPSPLRYRKQRARLSISLMRFVQNFASQSLLPRHFRRARQNPSRHNTDLLIASSRVKFCDSGNYSSAAQQSFCPRQMRHPSPPAPPTQSAHSFFLLARYLSASKSASNRISSPPLADAAFTTFASKRKSSFTSARFQITQPPQPASNSPELNFSSSLLQPPTDAPPSTVFYA